MIRLRDLGAPAWIREDHQWAAEHRARLEAPLQA